LVVALILTARFVVEGWHMRQDIGGGKERAQVSMDPSDMALYMTRVKEGMEKWGVTEGNSALFFPTPATDMSLIYRAVGQHIETAKSLEEMDKSSIQYATGLDNLRGGIRELTIPAYEYHLNHTLLGVNIACWVFYALFVIFIIWWSAIW